jgi:predicted transcriptional regulator YdeE
MAELARRSESWSGVRLQGMSVPITRSQSSNAEICARHWRSFNAALARTSRTASGSWEKFAVTYAVGEEYRYFCGVPATDPVPPVFETFDVPAHDHEVFDHRGPMSGLAATISAIYREELSRGGAVPMSEQLFHVERYDRRFHWSRPDSVIEIWVPVSRG